MNKSLLASNTGALVAWLVLKHCIDGTADAAVISLAELALQLQPEGMPQELLLAIAGARSYAVAEVVDSSIGRDALIELMTWLKEVLR